MRSLFFVSLCVLVVGTPQFLPEAQAAGTSYYVSPNGSSSFCTRQSPCSLTTGLSQAQAGDEVVLIDGRYASKLDTVRNGASGKPITIRAENKQKAIVVPPSNWVPGNMSIKPPTAGSAQYVRIFHSNITIRGLVLDGERRAFSILRVAGSPTNPISNIIVEDMILQNPQASQFFADFTKNIIVRHNLFRSVIRGEGWYWGPTGAVENAQVYGNTIQDPGSNAMDLKGTINAEVHHNIIERQWRGEIVAQDGIITFEGTGTHFHNNIIRNALSDTGSFDYVGLWNNHNIHNNVAYNITSPAILWYRSRSPLIATSRFTDNVFCNTNTKIMERHDTGSTGTPAGLVIAGNRFKAPQSECDAEVARILNEVKKLPGVGNNSFPPPTNLRTAGNGSIW